MAPGRLVTCVARVSVGEAAKTPAGLRALTTSQSLDQAAATLGRGSLDAIAYASTSTAYAIGFEGEKAFAARLSTHVGAPVAATGVSMVLALRILGAERIALVHPPWFDAELHELGSAYFQSLEFDVVSCASAALSQEPREIEAAAVYEWTLRNVPREAQAIVFGGTGFRTAEAIGALEARIGRSVLSANQALLWNLLSESGAAVEVSGYGGLFSQIPQPAGL